MGAREMRLDLAPLNTTIHSPACHFLLAAPAIKTERTKIDLMVVFCGADIEMDQQVLVTKVLSQVQPQSKRMISAASLSFFDAIYALRNLRRMD